MAEWMPGRSLASCRPPARARLPAAAPARRRGAPTAQWWQSTRRGLTPRTRCRSTQPRSGRSLSSGGPAPATMAATSSLAATGCSMCPQVCQAFSSVFSGKRGQVSNNSSVESPHECREFNRWQLFGMPLTWAGRRKGKGARAASRQDPASASAQYTLCCSVSAPAGNGSPVHFCVVLFLPLQATEAPRTCL